MTNENINENITENINENITENITENVTETKNPYLEQSNGEEPAKKSSNKVVIGIVAGVAAVVLILLIVAAAFSGIFSNKKTTVLKALGATLLESGDYIKEVYDAEQYEGLFYAEEYMIDAAFDTDYYGLDIDVSVMRKEDAQSMVQVSADLMGMEIGTNIYADDKEVVIELPGLLDYLLTINRETMTDDIQNLVEIGMLDQETVDELVAIYQDTDEDAISEESYEKLLGELRDTLKSFYDACEMTNGDSKKLTVDGESVKCKGYVLTFTGEDAAVLMENLKTVCQDNEEYLRSGNNIYNSSGLDNAYAADLDSLYERIDEAVKAYRDMKDEKTEIEFYLYKGKIAQICADGLEWNVEGGNFPLENTKITYENEFGDQVVVERTGSFENDRYEARYEAVNEYDESFAVEIQHKKGKGDFSLEALENGDSMMAMDGSIDKNDDDTIDIDIDKLEIDGESVLSGKISVSNFCDEIIRPTGEEKAMLRMSDMEWQQVVMDILDHLY